MSRARVGRKIRDIVATRTAVNLKNILRNQTTAVCIHIPNGYELCWGVFPLDCDVQSEDTVLGVGDLKDLLKDFEGRDDVVYTMYFRPKGEKK